MYVAPFLLLIATVALNIAGSAGLRRPNIPDQCYTETDEYICKKKFHIVSKPTKWIDAKNNCEFEVQDATSGRLASIVSYREERALEKALGEDEGVGGKFWLSGSDKAQEGRFRWITDGSSKLNYTNWGPSQPSGGAQKNCLSIHGDYRWYDDNCEDKFGYVCQYFVDRATGKVH